MDYLGHNRGDPLIGFSFDEFKDGMTYPALLVSLQNGTCSASGAIWAGFYAGYKAKERSLESDLVSEQ